MSVSVICATCAHHEFPQKVGCPNKHIPWVCADNTLFDCSFYKHDPEKERQYMLAQKEISNSTAIQLYLDAKREVFDLRKMLEEKVITSVEQDPNDLTMIHVNISMDVPRWLCEKIHKAMTEWEADLK